jgi:transposase
LASDFLHLWQWEVSDVTDTGDLYMVEARFEVQPASCEKCGVVGRPYKHGTVKQRVNDTTHSGKPVVIVWDRQRYRCQHCGETFLQPSKDIDPNHLMTTRLVKHIQNAVLTRTYTEVAREVGLSDGTVRNVFYAYAAELDARAHFIAPEILGIDELHIRGKARCILTNIGERTILDFLVDRKKEIVMHALMRLEQRQNVKVVAMDMYRPYLTVTKAVFPKAIAVVDKFHVQRMASQSLDAMRKLVGKGVSRRRGAFIKRNRHVLLRRPWTLDAMEQLLLAEWLGEIPELRTAYDLKERFYDIWENRDVTSARRALNAWREAIPGPMESLFKPLLTATKNWENEILNYFATNGVTNAFTEAMNRTLRDRDRAGRGYSFEVLRIKALYAHNDILRRRPQSARAMTRDSVGFIQQGEAVGVPLSTFDHALSEHDESQ